MKVLFLQKYPFIQIGTMSLSAFLKRNGHQCELLFLRKKNEVKQFILSFSPNLLAFSCTTGMEEWVFETAKMVREDFKIPVIVGGPHPTFHPEMVENENIDIICRGEGEIALSKLLDSWAKGEEASEINNLWIKKNGEIIKNPIGPLIEDLDTLPFADRTLYDKYGFLQGFYKDMSPIAMGRGCPFNCSHCFNRDYKNLYANKNKYIRLRAAENVIEEILEVKKKYKIRSIEFLDECFFFDKNWFSQFINLYQEKIRLPFTCNARADLIDEEMAKEIKQAGCRLVRIGLETGSERLRKNILKKNIGNDKYKKAAELIKKHGMSLQTFNIYGLPEETLENALETYKFNKELKVDFAWCSLLQPYPGTDIYKYAIEKNLIEEQTVHDLMGRLNFEESYFYNSPIKLEKKKEIINLQKLTQLSILLHLPFFLLKFLIRLPKNRFFHTIFKLSYSYSVLKYNKIKLLPFLRMSWYSQSYTSSKK